MRADVVSCSRIMASKQHILGEIKRTAAANDGVPLGSRRFATETGIAERDWKGKVWARWSDALREAGFAPNELTKAHGEEALLTRFADLSVRLGQLPAVADIRLQIANGLEFPDWNTFTRQFGGKQKFVARLREFCAERPEYSEVVGFCDQYVPRARDREDAEEPQSGRIGYVYLMRHGMRREYKIGRTDNALRREGEISIELPEKALPVHVIETDDPGGIEAYWHRRFADKRLNGEWFELTSADVAAFKRRKFM